ncbi:ATPase domain-containing protein [Metabacillus halosaccharovorans]|uniref:ATPase domain-containing protein n=1 Tax=Metabacillus halosaccharovorans TaxID=930124 RepID=UPI00203D8D69|nr:ATPase domain-containing protein [Metabacillus halosaccharovorans]MCM3443380.1 AAA family ATPase [Metabacillus halosaccharovorans]
MNHIVTTGIEGLDFILNGGIPAGSSLLIDGAPGTGKTILGMQFLYNGAIENNEPGIYITFEQFPEQIYKDMLAFGWDIKALENENKLRVICISPDILIDQMMKQDGIFEQMIKQIDCKRIVIDSLNLLNSGLEKQDEKRKLIYTLRNILRRYSLTSMLIHEQTTLLKEEIPFESYVVDGVIRLSLKEQNVIYRKRTLEVLKMRGCKIREGEHIYRINEAGLHLIPALSMIEDKVIINDQTTVSTGIPSLDRLLSGGIPKGTSFILDTNSKANYKYIAASIITSRLLAGERAIILSSSLSTMYDLKHLYLLYGVDLDELVKQEKVYFIEHYERPIPVEYESAVIRVNHLDDVQYKQIIRKKLGPIFEESLRKEERWFIYYDINTIISERGKSFVKRFFAEEIAKTSAAGVSMIALCNFTEIGKETASFLERTCNGVFQTWVDGNYQYFQLKKSPQGKMSEPLLVENIQQKPFVRLV